MPGSELHKQDIDLLIARIEAIITTFWDTPEYLENELKMLSSTLLSLVRNSAIMSGDEQVVYTINEKVKAIIKAVEENVARSEVQ
jgi:hypothetical protein